MAEPFPPLKPKQQLQAIIDQIASDASPVGMDAVYVHAAILEKLQSIEDRLQRLEAEIKSGVDR